MRLIIFDLILATILLSCTDAQKNDFADKEDLEDYATPDAEIPKPVSGRRTHVVEIIQMKFVPATVNVNSGDTIVWKNRDLVEHDVTEKNRNIWTSSRIKPGSSWRLVVTESQLYYCSLHVVMEGKIVVDGNDIAMNQAVEITMCGDPTTSSVTSLKDNNTQ